MYPTQQLVFKPIKTETFITFCETDNFKKYVRSAISDQLFWNNLLQEMNMSTYIKNEIADRLPDKVKVEINKIVPDKIEKELNHFSRYRIPECVSEQLKKQMTDYLNNDLKMQQLMTVHSNKLEEELQIKAKQILDRVTNEEQYHVVTNSHIENMKKRFEDQLAEFNRTMDWNIATYNTMLQVLTSNVHDQVDRELLQTRECTNKVNALDEQLKQLKKENNTHWLFTLISMSIATISTGILIYQYTQS
jgi:hypothetical protein